MVHWRKNLRCCGAMISFFLIILSVTLTKSMAGIVIDNTSVTRA